MPLKVISISKLFLLYSSTSYIMNEFFDLKKECFALEIIRSLCFWSIQKFWNFCYHKHYCSLEVSFSISSLNPRKLTLVQLNRNIFKMPSALMRRLETSFLSFNYRDKMTVQSVLLIFNTWYLIFWLPQYSLLKQ